MRTLVIPGGSEADSRPDGRYVAYVKHRGGCQTEWGFLPNPSGDEVRWPVLAYLGGMIACQGQNDPPKGWTWTRVGGSGWEKITAPCGVWPVIFNNNNWLLVSDCGPGVGSQGYRYVTWNTNHVVTGDATVTVRKGLNEWTDLSYDQDGSLLVGQLNTGQGVGVCINNTMRLLTAGACYNVRAKYDYDLNLYSISCYNVAPDGVETRIFWLTPAELAALPLLPTLPVDKPMVKPEITVSQFKFTPANKLADGVWLEFHDRQNAQGAVVRVWVSGGGMYMSVEYPGIGKGETGAWRPVR